MTAASGAGWAAVGVFEEMSVRSARGFGAVAGVALAAAVRRLERVEAAGSGSRDARVVAGADTGLEAGAVTGTGAAMAAGAWAVAIDVAGVEVAGAWALTGVRRRSASANRCAAARVRTNPAA